jgi:hypothetical protein
MKSNGKGNPISKKFFIHRSEYVLFRVLTLPIQYDWFFISILTNYLSQLSVKLVDQLKFILKDTRINSFEIRIYLRKWFRSKNNMILVHVPNFHL